MTTVVHHSADFDGVFCREIARKFLSGAEPVGWDFGNDKIPWPNEGLVYVLDLPPDCLELPDINEVGRKMIWIDHHKSSIEKWPEVLPGYRIDGVAACRLAWQWFIKESRPFIKSLPTKQEYLGRSVVEPLAVRLAGEYDIWDKRDNQTDILQFGLRSRELTEDNWRDLLSVTSSSMILDELLSNGELLQIYQRRCDEGMMKRSFIVEFEGLKFLALTTARCNSLTFMSKDVPETNHDALMGLYWDGNKWGVSLYHASHRKELDLSPIAVKYGGGGHRGACGFQTNSLPWFK